MEHSEHKLDSVLMNVTEKKTIYPITSLFFCLFNITKTETHPLLLERNYIPLMC